jgi:hypothetical protein
MKLISSSARRSILKHFIVVLLLSFSVIGMGQSKADTVFTNKAGVYFFEPCISVITGKLKVEMYYGPPNYGETPSTDSKEYSYVFYPDKAIDVIQRDSSNSSNYSDKTTRNVKKFQLAPTGNITLHPYVNKKLKITGEFFGAITGHHHTDVLMSVEKVEQLKKF